MAGFFVKTSSMQMLASSRVTTYPFTIGIWVRPTIAAAAVNTITALDDNTTGANSFGVVQQATNFAISVNNAAAISATSTTPVLNSWQYLLARFISSSSVTLSMLGSDGTISHATGNPAVTPTGIVGERLGGLPASNFFDGHLAEFFLSNIDIQSDGAQLRNETLYQLAYQGPFSFPHIISSIVDYRSLRTSMISATDNMGDFFFGSGGRPLWSMSAAVVLPSPHPSLGPRYAFPPNRGIIKPLWFRGFPPAPGGAVVNRRSQVYFSG